MPRVSVLLPCRNAAEFLPEALGSLLAQTYADFEIIAVDDASTDATSSILDAWRERDRRVRPVTGAGQGIVAALQFAAAHASGEILARMDADDVCEPNRFALQVCALDADSDLAGCGAAVRYFPRRNVRDGALRYERWLNSLTTAETVRRDAFIECPVAHPALVLRRDAFEEVGGYRDRGWPEDYDLVLRLLVQGHELTNVPEVLLHWREGADRLSRTDGRYAEEAFRRCKVEHLVPRFDYFDGVVVWGAGPVGKAFGRLLLERQVALRAFVELDPRKIGQTIHGVPVIAPGEVGAYHGAYVLAAVAGPTARAEIRTSLRQAGWTEGRDFVAVA